MMPGIALLQLLALAAIASTMHTAPLPLKRIAGGRRRVIATTGWSLLAASAIVAGTAANPAQALLSWFGLLSIDAALVLLLCTALRPVRPDR